MTSIKVLCLKPIKKNLMLDNKNLVVEYLMTQSDKTLNQNKYIFTNISGNWYQIFSKKSFDSGAYKNGSLDVIDYKYNPKKNSLKKAFCDDKSLNYRVVFSKEYFEDFFTMLKKLIDYSSIQSVLVEFYVQEKCSEKIIGTFDIETFKKLLLKKEIIYNVSYFITGNKVE